MADEEPKGEGVEVPKRVERFTSFDNPRHPLYPLRDSLRSVTNYVNIKEAAVVNTHNGLPVDIKPGWGMSAGGFGVYVDKEGKTSLLITFSSRDGLTDPNEEPEWTRREELFHLLHVTGNETLFQLEKEESVVEDKLRELRAHGVSEAVALAEKSKRYTNTAVDGFLARARMDVPSQTEEQKIRHALSITDLDRKYQTGSVSRLTYGQELRLLAALEKNGHLERDEARKLGMNIDDATRSRRHIEDTKAQPDADSFENREFIESWTRNFTLSRKVTYGQLQQKIGDLLSQGKVEEVVRVFRDADVSLDTLGNRIGWVRESIYNLSDEETKNVFLNLLASGLTPEELSFLTYASGDDGLHWELRKAIDNKDGEKIEEIKRKLEEQLKTEDVKAVRLNVHNERRSAIYELLMRGQRESVAKAMVEQNLMWFAEDLPPEGPQRTALLQNPQFMQMYEEAILKALRDPEASPLGPIDFEPSQVAKGGLESQKILDAALERSTKNFDAAAFVEESRKHAEFLLRFGSLADNFEMEAERHKDEIMLAMGLDAANFELVGDLAEKLGTTHEELVRRVDSQAAVESLEYMKLEQDAKMKHTEEQFLLEPIAKVVVAQSMGKGIKDIEFPEGMMGGYTQLLREGGIEAWLKKLWKFVEKVHKNGENGGRKMLEFMKAGNLEEQRNIVEGYRS